MQFLKLCIITLGLAGLFYNVQTESPDSLKTCRKAFVYKTDDYSVANLIKICSTVDQVPFEYEVDLNMAVCDDKLCANVYLNIFFDLAGNYVRLDTITGKALTKFDHKPFTDADYKKLDQILKDQNSMLRILEKEDLVDKSVKLKATTVDAVTGATPKAIKNAVVEGAVYSSFTLWHFIYSAVKDSMAAYTRRIYSDPIAFKLLNSKNYETQLFALRQWTGAEFEIHSELLFQVIVQSVPLVRAFIISKAPLPFQSMEKNKAFVALFPDLDGYSKSIFLTRITAEKGIAETFLPLMIPMAKQLDEKQLKKLKEASENFKIGDFTELH